MITAEEATADNRVILVTGFGPFIGHPTNASWEAVKELRNLDIERKFNVSLVTEEIPVAYESVLNLIPKLWLQHSPMLVVHVGVSASARCLTLESRAYNSGYCRPDVYDKKCPLENGDDKYSAGDMIAIETGLDVKKICDDINSCNSSCKKDDDKCKAIVSENAGRYLCEYIYRQSLLINPKKTLFVHVPDLRTYSAKKTADGLYEVIKFAVELIDNKKL